MKKTLLIICLLFSAIITHAQLRVIRGKITDAKDGSPLPGVSVQVKGTRFGTITDIAGLFTLRDSVTDGNTLLISYVGYKNEEFSVPAKGLVFVALKEQSNKLNELVVIGYGVARKKDLTGVTSRVNGNEITSIATSSPTQAIQGKAAGVQITAAAEPGGKPNVRIRGTGSILGGVDPLYVVDGILTDDISNINSNDIVSIDVLKDAASTAIYGVRGANGVILVTTKNGTKGKMQVTYDSYYGFKRLANKVDMAGPGLFATYSNEAAGTMAVKREDITGSTDWMDAITRIGTIQNHALSLSGGGERNTYFFSAAYMKEEGILKGNDFERLSIRSNNTYDLNKHFKFGNTISFAFSHSNNKPFSLFTSAYNAAPIYNAKNPDGSYGSTSISDVGNPLAALELTNDQTYNNRMQGTVFGEYTIIKGLSFRSSFGMDGNFGNGFNYAPVYKISATQKNDRSQLTLSRSYGYHWTWDNYFTYHQTYASNHDVTVTLGHTAELQDGRYLSGSKKDIPSQPQYWDFSFGDPTSITLSSGNQSIYGRRESYFARGIYSYKDKYLFNATVRRDGASKFPVQNRWGTFPSVGLGWVLTKESFMQHQTFLDVLKLRSSWGMIGNDNITPGQFVTQFSSGLGAVFGGTISPGAIPDQIVDPNLKWETTQETNLGIEFSMLNKRLTGEIDVYNKTTSNALYLVALPGVAGDRDNVYLTNAATITNKGVEISLGWSSNIKNKVNYTIRGNVTFNQNSVDNVGQGKALDYGSLDNGYTSTRVVAGQPIGVFWVYKTNGNYQSDAEVANSPHVTGAQAGDKRIVDVNGDGKIDNLDRVYAGSYQPKFYYGFNTNWFYKNFDLGMIIQGNYGNVIFNGKKTVRYGGNYNVEYDVAMNRWTNTNRTNDNPRAYNGVPVPNDYYIESGTYIRLNNITLGYTLPGVVLSKFKMAKFRVYVSAQNALTFKKFSGYSSELPGAPYESGIEKSIYPTSSTYMMGINVQF